MRHNRGFQEAGVVFSANHKAAAALSLFTARAALPRGEEVRRDDRHSHLGIHDTRLAKLCVRGRVVLLTRRSLRLQWRWRRRCVGKHIVPCDAWRTDRWHLGRRVDGEVLRRLEVAARVARERIAFEDDAVALVRRRRSRRGIGRRWRHGRSACCRRGALRLREAIHRVRVVVL